MNFVRMTLFCLFPSCSIPFLTVYTATLSDRSDSTTHFGTVCRCVSLGVCCTILDKLSYIVTRAVYDLSNCNPMHVEHEMLSVLLCLECLSFMFTFCLPLKQLHSQQPNGVGPTPDHRVSPAADRRSHQSICLSNTER